MEVWWTPNNLNMDDAVDPDKANFSMKVDGVPRTITDITWQSSLHILVESSGIPAVTDFEITYHTVDNAVLNTDGVVAVPPQTMESTVP